MNILKLASLYHVISKNRKIKKETMLFPVYTEICKKCNLCVLCYNDPQTLPSFGILPSKFIIDTL